MQKSALSTTLTGADEHTKIADLLAIASWPHVEIGLLYTYAPEGRHRYPSLRWLIDAATRVAAVGRLAIHICGGRARQQLLAGDLADLVGYAGRIQVNGALQAETVEHLCALYPKHTVITQHSDANAHLVSQVRASNHAILVDNSGGRGVLPLAWARPETTKAVGFAGGLGPDNIAEQRKLIENVAAGEWWIDMEGRLRDSFDWFDYGRAQAVARSTRKECQLHLPTKEESPRQ